MFITHTDELHIHFGVLLHVLQQVHVEGLSLEQAKEPSPSSLCHIGCYTHYGEGWLVKRAELVTLLPPGPYTEARNGHIRATVEQPCSLGVSAQHPPGRQPLSFGTGTNSSVWKG